MKTLKKALSIILCLALMLSCVAGMQISASAEGEEATTPALVLSARNSTYDLYVPEKEGLAGVHVDVGANAGFAALGYEVTYDEGIALHFVAKDGNAMTGYPITDENKAVSSENTSVKPYKMQWAFESNQTVENFTIAYLEFALPEGVAAGTEYNVTFTVKEAWDENGNAVPVTESFSATITVVDNTPTVEPDESECEHEWTIAKSTAAVGVAPATGSADKAGTEESKGSITLACEKCGHTEDPQEVSYYDDYRPNSLNLDLAAEIKFNFYVTDSRLVDAEEVFFVTSLMIEGADPKVQVLSLEDAPDDTAKSRQIVSTGIPSKFLTDQLVMNVFLKKDGVWYSGRTYSYSIVDAAHLKDGKSTEDEYKMYVALFNFGAKAQTYFNYKTDNLANSVENLGYFVDYPLDVEEPAITAQMTNNRGTQGVRFRAYDYNLDAKTILNLKFTVSEATNPPEAEDINVRFTHNSQTYIYGYEELTYETDNDRYIVNFGELTSRQWRDPIIAVVYNGDVAYDCSFETSIAGLMQYSIEKGNAKNDAKLAALYKSMINYGDYADAYFANM